MQGAVSYPLRAVLELRAGDASTYCQRCWELISGPGTDRARCACGTPVCFVPETTVAQMLDLFRTRADYRRLMSLLEINAQEEPIVIEDGAVIDGHHRITALVDLHATQIWVAQPSADLA